jgi:16S rRNA (uracil1498-N3)-methyltransferase
VKFHIPSTVNLILFDPGETHTPLPRPDPRAVHVLEVLRRKEGDSFDVGLIDGPRGKGTVVAIQSDAILLEFTWGLPPPELDPIQLIIGLPRPQTARKILQEVTALGISSVHFVTTERGEASYAQSTLWKSGEWRRHVIAGAEQAFCTRLPQITFGRSLDAVLAEVETNAQRIALDNYEASHAFSALSFAAGSAAALALGSERGWTAKERELLRKHAFVFAHLGSRVLRTETAVVASLVLLRAKLGFLS